MIQLMKSHYFSTLSKFLIPHKIEDIGSFVINNFAWDFKSHLNNFINFFL